LQTTYAVEFYLIYLAGVQSLQIAEDGGWRAGSTR